MSRTMKLIAVGLVVSLIWNGILGYTQWTHAQTIDTLIDIERAHYEKLIDLRNSDLRFVLTKIVDLEHTVYQPGMSLREAETY